MGSREMNKCSTAYGIKSLSLTGAFLGREERRAGAVAEVLDGEAGGGKEAGGNAEAAGDGVDDGMGAAGDEEGDGTVRTIGRSCCLVFWNTLPLGRRAR